METHRNLNAGEKIQADDEYITGSVWRTVPKFLIGDKVPVDSNTQWRRSVKSETVVKSSDKHWFSFFWTNKTV